MTRVIGGIAKGRTLKVPASARPTADRVRESVFTAMEHRLGSFEGLSVIDLFAGSGALALEALSRGAASAIAVESNRKAAEVIRSNAQTLGLPLRVEVQDAFRMVASRSAAGFDVIFADPPYESFSDEQISKLLDDIRNNGWLAEDGWLVLERSGRKPMLTLPPGAVESEERKYGDTSVILACW